MPSEAHCFSQTALLEQSTCLMNASDTMGRLADYVEPNELDIYFIRGLIGMLEDQLRCLAGDIRHYVFGIGIALIHIDAVKPPSEFKDVLVALQLELVGIIETPRSPTHHYRDLHRYLREVAGLVLHMYCHGYRLNHCP